MDNKRGVEGSGGGMGEVVDMRTGAVEDGGFGAKQGETMIGGTEKVGEKAGQVGQGVSVGMPPVMMMGDDDGQQTTSVSGKLQSDLVNLTTKDGENIEKEWIKKCRDIVGDTREDPKRREDEVFEVKKDFILKRFGRKIGGGK